MSTRNFVPRSGSEGQIGTQEKPWGVVVADIGHFTNLSGSISGSVSSTGSFGRLEIAGNSNLIGDITIGGNINIGDADTDSLTIAADLTSNLVPNVDSTYDIGSTSKNWKFGYIEELAVTNITASGDITNISTTHITASGNISASGTVFASRFESIGDAGETISFNDNLNITGNITASNNISASGDIRADGRIFEKNTSVIDHATAMAIVFGG
jgi:hypothetical protein